jgi:polyhydroxyalkanoate synthesis repressor PhaR
MPLIKRYPNRKLYDTEAKQYITLEGIAELVRRGEEIQVIDHASGEDLTSLTLTQIIYEQEKKQSGVLPKSVLSGLIQAGSEKLSTVRRALASPLDFLRQVDEEIELRIEYLIDQNELPLEEAHRIREKLLSLGRHLRANSLADEQRVEQILAERNVPSQEEIQRLSDRIEDLSAMIDDLKEEQDAGG